MRLLADVGVIGALVGWTAIGFINTDDYYYTLEARTLDVGGFVGNQFRYFNVPEIPFVLHQMLLAPLTELSTAPFVLRLPSLLAGIAVWLLLTRQLVPLLVERPHPAVRLVAGIAFLAWWLPWNIGGRPESMVTLAWAVTLTLALQAIRRDRVWLLGLAAAVAGTAVTITASGLSCVVTLLVLAPRLWPVVRDSALGRWPTLALVVASASLPAAIVFSDASLATALTALRVHQERGPAEAWYEELLRYYYLTMGPDPNQSTFARQVVVLATLVLVIGVSVVLLRTTRLTAATATWSVPALAYLAANAALLPSPTKWTHHFGALAAPGALAVTVAVVVLARRRPDRWASAVLAGVLALTAALAYHGGNHQVEYSDYAVDEDLPGILGNPVPWLAIGLLAVALPWWWHRRRAGEGAGQVSVNWPGAAIGTLVAVLVTSVLLQTGSATLAEYRLRNTWSMGGDTLDTLTGGGGCGFADSAAVLTEPRALPAAAPPTGRTPRRCSRSRPAPSPTPTPRTSRPSPHRECGSGRRSARRPATSRPRTRRRPGWSWPASPTGTGSPSRSPGSSTPGPPSSWSTPGPGTAVSPPLSRSSPSSPARAATASGSSTCWAARSTCRRAPRSSG